MEQKIDPRIRPRIRRKFWQTCYLSALNSDRLNALTYLGTTRQEIAAEEADAAIVKWDARFPAERCLDRKKRPR